MALTQAAIAFEDKPSRTSVGDEDHDSSSWSMELSRWRVRLRRLKRWSRYEGRASDGQFDTNDLPESERLRRESQPVRQRHSLTSLGSVSVTKTTTPQVPSQRYHYEHVVPPVCIPSIYRQQDRHRGVRVSDLRVPFTLDGHKRRRKMIRPLPRVVESEPLELETVPDMRSSLASVYARMGRPTRSRRACSV